MPRKLTTRQEEFAKQGSFFSFALKSQPLEMPSASVFLRDTNFKPYFYTSRGALYNADAVEFLSSLPSNSVDCIFADPPYNIGKAEWDIFPSLKDYVTWVERWLVQCHRVLNESGSVYVMGFSEILAHISVMSDELFSSVRWLIWSYRNKANLGKKDWTRSHEGILHLRKSDDSPFYIDYIREPYNLHTEKYPERANGETSQFANGKKHAWSVNQGGAKPRDVIDIPAISNGMKESTEHPTQKPEELLRRLILAVTQPGQLVIDPFGGSGSTFVVCEQLKRSWLGCEWKEDYCKLAVNRLTQVPEKPIEYWVEQDRKRQIHRMKVRAGE